LPNRNPTPGTLSDQLLHRLQVALGQTRRHGLDRFAFAVQQQPAHVNRTRVASLAPPQWLQQVGQKLFQAPLGARSPALLRRAPSPQGRGPPPALSPDGAGRVRAVTEELVKVAARGRTEGGARRGHRVRCLRRTGRQGRASRSDGGKIPPSSSWVPCPASQNADLLKKL